MTSPGIRNPGFCKRTDSGAKLHRPFQALFMAAYSILYHISKDVRDSNEVALAEHRKKSTSDLSATGLSLTCALETFYKAHARDIIKNKAN